MVYISFAVCCGFVLVSGNYSYDQGASQVVFCTHVRVACNVVYRTTVCTKSSVVAVHYDSIGATRQCGQCDYRDFDLIMFKVDSPTKNVFTSQCLIRTL